jgi:predicted metalloprotease with PDZ domain
MLAAFIYDLSLRSATNCGAKLDDLYSELFRRSATGHGSANEIIIKVMSEQPDLRLFAENYVKRATTIDLKSVVSSYGIDVQRSAGGATKLTVSQNLNQAQRKLVGCIRSRR